MKKRILSLLLCLTMLLPLLPTMAFADGTALTALHITGPASVKAGTLPEIDAEVAADGHAYVAHDGNTRWRKQENGVWYDADPVAVKDGSTRYGMLLCVNTDSGYSITKDTTVYYNGTKAPGSVHNIFSWGAYILIDLGLATGENVTTHTVTFDTKGGSSVSAVSVAHGDKVSKHTPTKAGATFAGWYTDTGCTVPFDFNTPITADITLYAKWNEKTVLPVLHITGPASVAAGTLPKIDAEVIAGEHARVEHTGNTRWQQQPAGGNWQSMNAENLVAVKDGSTRYGMLLCVDTDRGYSITEDTKIYYNGNAVSDGIYGVYSWGAYIRIDLGTAVSGPAVPITTLTVTGIDEPVVGQHPDFSYTIADAAKLGITSRILWVKFVNGHGVNLTESDVFEAGIKYACYIYVDINEDENRYFSNVTEYDEYGYEYLSFYGSFTVNDSYLEAYVKDGARSLYSYWWSKEAVSASLFGDINLDGALSILDVTALLLEISKPGSPSAERLAICDVNGDGALSILDVSAILLML